MSTTQTKLLEIPEAATRLRVCVRMYYRLVQKKELPPPVKVSAKSLVPESDIEDYIARRIQARNST